MFIYININEMSHTYDSQQVNN